MDKDSLLETLKLFSEAERLKALELIVQGKLFTSSDKKLDNISVSDNSYLFVGDNQVNTIERGSFSYSKKSNNKRQSTEDYTIQTKGVYLGDSWHDKVFAPLVARTALWNCDSTIGPLFPPHNGRVWKKTFPQGVKGLGIMLKECNNIPAGYLKCSSIEMKDAKGPECVVLFRKQVFEKAVEVGLITIQQGDTDEKAAPKEEEKKNEGANEKEVANPFESTTSQKVNEDGTFSWN